MNRLSLIIFFMLLLCLGELALTSENVASANATTKRSDVCRCGRDFGGSTCGYCSTAYSSYCCSSTGYCGVSPVFCGQGCQNGPCSDGDTATIPSIVSGTNQMIEPLPQGRVFSSSNQGIADPVPAVKAQNGKLPKCIPFPIRLPNVADGSSCNDYFHYSLTECDIDSMFESVEARFHMRRMLPILLNILEAYDLNCPKRIAAFMALVKYNSGDLQFNRITNAVNSSVGEIRVACHHLTQIQQRFHQVFGQSCTPVTLQTNEPVSTSYDSLPSDGTVADVGLPAGWNKIAPPKPPTMPPTEAAPAAGGKGKGKGGGHHKRAVESVLDTQAVESKNKNKPPHEKHRGRIQASQFVIQAPYLNMGVAKPTTPADSTGCMCGRTDDVVKLAHDSFPFLLTAAWSVVMGSAEDPSGRCAPASILRHMDIGFGTNVPPSGFVQVSNCFQQLSDRERELRNAAYQAVRQVTDSFQLQKKTAEEYLASLPPVNEHVSDLDEISNSLGLSAKQAYAAANARPRNNKGGAALDGPFNIGAVPAILLSAGCVIGVIAALVFVIQRRRAEDVDNDLSKDKGEDGGIFGCFGARKKPSAVRLAGKKKAIIRTAAGGGTTRGVRDNDDDSDEWQISPKV